jgi:DNA-nicking Smr family endonuclease
MRPLGEEELAVWWLETARDTAIKPRPPTPDKPVMQASSAPRARGEASLPAAKNTRARDLVPGALSGLDAKQAKRFVQAKLPLDATLDLHGMHQPQAHSAVLHLLRSAHTDGLRHVRIITGKGLRGGGVLKQELLRWLNDPQIRHYILALSYAKPERGGEGAMHVLLRRPHKVHL